jgi:hypothetical protein
MAKYRAAVIGLGWMGLLYDLAKRVSDRFEIGDVDRPTPSLDIHRRFHHHDHPGEEGNPTSYSEALWARPETELVAAADRDGKRLKAFSERYGIQQVYTSAEEMLRAERPEVVAVCTNTATRADLTCLAVECGARAIFTEKPMAHTLAEADRMVETCRSAGVPLSCGCITTTHPSFARAREIVDGGGIGEILSIESAGPGAQHQNWSYFLDHLPAWVVGAGDEPRRDSGSDEFTGQGMAWGAETGNGPVLHFRKGAPGVRLSGSKGELSFGFGAGWRLQQEVETADGVPAVVEVPWPKPQFNVPYGAIYSLDDILSCLAGDLDEPKNSGRRVAIAMEVEVALKLSAAKGGERVGLPLADRGLGLNYDWFR